MGLNSYFSGIPEDYSNYHWYKGENENPYKNDTFHPLAASFWKYERDFHFRYLDKADTQKSLTEAYNEWKNEFINEYLPGKSPNPYGDETDWRKVFEQGTRNIDLTQIL